MSIHFAHTHMGQPRFPLSHAVSFAHKSLHPTNHFVLSFLLLGGCLINFIAAPLATEKAGGSRPLESINTLLEPHQRMRMRLISCSSWVVI